MAKHYLDQILDKLDFSSPTEGMDFRVALLEL